MVSKEITPDRTVSDLFNYLMYAWLFSPPRSSPAVVEFGSGSILINFVDFGVDFFWLIVGVVSVVFLEMLPLS
jgi:hypothetical protein